MMIPITVCQGRGHRSECFTTAPGTFLRVTTGGHLLCQCKWASGCLACLRYSPWGGKEVRQTHLQWFFCWKSCCENGSYQTCMVKGPAEKGIQSFSPISQLIVWTLWALLAKPLTSGFSETHYAVPSVTKLSFCPQATTDCFLLLYPDWAPAYLHTHQFFLGGTRTLVGSFELSH